MRTSMRTSFIVAAASVVLVLVLNPLPLFADASEEQEPQRTIRAAVQMRPGGPVEDVEMDVHAAPVDPPSISAEEANLSLDDEEIVLGLVVDGTPIAYPIRYLATTEVMNDRVGDTAISPTW